MRWYIGLSGWGYDAWNGAFYPKGTKAAERLEFYAKHFDTVEINNSFYRLPKREQIDAWQRLVPEDFTFAVKAWRGITHYQKLQALEENLPLLMQPLTQQPKIGPVIFQLPPQFGKDMVRLTAFLRNLPKHQRFTIEFRHPDWHSSDVYHVLEKYNIAFCLFEKGEQRSPRITTADFTYVRLHGRKANYKGNYSQAELDDWHDWLKAQQQDAYVYFDNTNEKLYALENALSLKAMCSS